MLLRSHSSLPLILLLLFAGTGARLAVLFGIEPPSTPCRVPPYTPVALFLFRHPFTVTVVITERKEKTKKLPILGSS